MLCNRSSSGSVHKCGQDLATDELRRRRAKRRSEVLRYPRSLLGIGGGRILFRYASLLVVNYPSVFHIPPQERTVLYEIFDVAVVDASGITPHDYKIARTVFEDVQKRWGDCTVGLPKISH